jgi:hypothetical protein
MIDTYNALLKQLQEKSEAELKPEKKIEEKKNREVVEVAETLSSEGVISEIGRLKLEIGEKLTHISDGLEEEVSKFNQIQKAIEIKDEELKEFKDWATDAPGDNFERVFDKWKERCTNPNDIKEMKEFIKKNFPGWEIPEDK